MLPITLIIFDGSFSRSCYRLPVEIYRETHIQDEIHVLKVLPFWEFEIYALFNTDSDLANIETVFSNMKKYLNYETKEQLKLHVLDDFLNYS
jgi:hypothetical protein